ncbi:MAG: acetyl-CoA C-acetyltransferase [Conexivisphaerales archaeon]
MEENDVYVVDFKRTAFSRARPNEPEKDVFNSIRMDQALAQLIRTIVEENDIAEEEIGDVITGCALQVDENWLYGGRHPVLLAKLPVSVPSVAMDRACASSMNAAALGSFEIMTGHSDIVLAGGMEHMTHVPMANNPHIAVNMRLLLRPEYMKYQMNIGYVMGLTAEKLAEETGITREEMDRYSLESHRRAASSYDQGWYKDEIIPMNVEVEGKEVTVDRDLSIRQETSMEQLSKLPPAFKDNGVITAGNSSPLNSGASMLLLVSGKKVKESGLKPLAKILGFGWAGVEPSVMGRGPVPATMKALRKVDLNIDMVERWEINEAFAVVVLNAIKELSLDPSKVNVHGGAIAIGHPLGASGARLIGTLARQLHEEGKEYGVATLCVGGGQGFTTVLQRA